jgi:hypothetical protein
VVTFVDAASGQFQFTVDSGENQEKPTTRGGLKLPIGTILVIGSVTNGKVSGNNGAGLAMQLKDSTGQTVWSSLDI